MKFLIITNLVYFLLISILHQKALNSKSYRYPGEPRRYSWLNDNYERIIEFTSEWCWPAFSIRNCGKEDGARELILQSYWVFGKLFIHLPLKPWFVGEWGFTFFSICGGLPDQLHLNYGRKVKIIDLPWALDYCQTKYLMADGSWESDGRGKNIPDRWDESFRARLLTEVHPYLYVLKDGTAQKRLATITYETRNWRRKWLPFTGLFSYTSPAISIEFNDGVGERVHTWKGGVLGCNFRLKPGETGLDALKRMEATRKF